MRKQHPSSVRPSQIFAPDGVVLSQLVVTADPSPRRTCVVVNSQAMHVRNFEATLSGIAASGWRVVAADLRGHGHSVGPRAPLGHMEPGRGWERLVDDLDLVCREAFRDVPWAERALVAPNIGASLALDLCKRRTDVAGALALVAAPPNQPVLMGLARTLARTRMALRDAGEPDELLMQQLYSFLGGHLGPGARPIEVVSADRAVTAALEADPLAWFTPTTGYFAEMFRGVGGAWDVPSGTPTPRMPPGQRVLLLYGGDDPMTARGGYVPDMAEALRGWGVGTVDAVEVAGGRAGLIVDEASLGVAARVSAWLEAGGTSAAPAPSVPRAEAEEMSGRILRDMGVTDAAQPLEPSEIVDLCYRAIEDPNAWTELVHRWALTAARDDADAEAFQELSAASTLAAPHLERALRIEGRLVGQGTVRRVLEDMLDRMQIGFALVDAEDAILAANAAFAEALDRLVPAAGCRDAPLDVRLVTAVEEVRPLPRTGEHLLMSGGRAIGLRLRPGAVRGMPGDRSAVAGVVILRDPDGRGTVPILRALHGLTDKEAETVALICAGDAPDAIAETLGVSINTIRSHLRAAYEKVGVPGKSELVTAVLGGPVGLLAR